MSADRMMENLHKEIQEFLDSQATSDMSIDQLNELLQKHIVRHCQDKRARGSQAQDQHRS